MKNYLKSIRAHFGITLAACLAFGSGTVISASAQTCCLDMQPAGPIQVHLNAFDFNTQNTLTTLADAGLVKASNYVWWCVDVTTAHNNVDDAPIFQNTLFSGAVLYSACDPGLLSYPPLIGAGLNNIGAVNYIINHKQGTYYDIQDAIWSFVGGPAAYNNPVSAASQSMIADALANPNYQPPCGSNMAVIVDFPDQIPARDGGIGFPPGYEFYASNGGNIQRIIIEVPCVCPPVPSSCEVTPDATICAGESKSFTVTINGGTAPHSISWTGPNGFTSTDATITVSDAGTYSVTTTDSTPNNPQTTSCSATLTVTTGIPVFQNCPGDLNLGCNPNPSTIPTCNQPATVIASDNNGRVVVNCSGATDQADGCNRIRTITYTAQNACGIATCVQKITWKSDTDAPTIVCPPDITVSNTVSQTTNRCTYVHTHNSSCNYGQSQYDWNNNQCNWWGSQSNWNGCNFSDSWNYFFRTYCSGSSSNSNTNISPTVSGFATATDGCDPNPTVTYSDVVTAGACNGTYQIARTWTATDSCGNRSSCTQKIFVGNSKGSICGRVFADCDGSGDLTGADAGLSNAIVTLKDANKVTVATATTDANGNYCFYELVGGNYTVTVTPPAGYEQTAGSTRPQWKDRDGRTCWDDNDGYSHYKDSDGKDCWKDKDGYNHWKDDDNNDCWKDRNGYTRRQKCNYTSCYVPKNNCETVKLDPCEAQNNVNFAYTGKTQNAVVCVTGPSNARCGDNITYTCTVTNTGNVCFTKGCKVTVFGKSYTCPPLSPKEKCSFQVKYTCNKYDAGDFDCRAVLDCYSPSGNRYTTQSSCRTKIK